MWLRALQPSFISGVNIKAVTKKEMLENAKIIFGLAAVRPRAPMGGLGPVPPHACLPGPTATHVRR